MCAGFCPILVKRRSNFTVLIFKVKIGDQSGIATINPLAVVTNASEILFANNSGRPMPCNDCAEGFDHTANGSEQTDHRRHRCNYLQVIDKNKGLANSTKGASSKA